MGNGGQNKTECEKKEEKKRRRLSGDGLTKKEPSRSDTEKKRQKKWKEKLNENAHVIILSSNRKTAKTQFG